MPARCNRGFYCRSYCLLNMFRAALCPLSGTQDYYTVVAVCGIWCCDFQVVGLVWSWGLCVRFAGCCSTLQTGHITLQQWCIRWKLGIVGHRTHCTKYTPESIAWLASPRTLLLIEVISLLLWSNFIYFSICIIPASLRTSSLIEVISVPLYSTLFKLQ